ncbi:hypothetical protein RYX36_019441 [Vicia faba]
MKPMASPSLQFHLLPSLSKFQSSISPLSQHHTHPFTSTTSLRFTSTNSTTTFTPKPLSLCFALTESNSPNSTQPDPKTLLQDIADSFDLPSDYFAKFPNDLRLDLNDAAFDLSNGPVLDECGKELGETLLNLSRAWELADTSSSRSLVAKLPLIEASLTGTAKSALGKRMVSAGRRFQSMGQYGQGETQKIAKAMIAAGRALSANSTSAVIDEQPKEESRTLKFGALQVEITPVKANIGAAIALVFGILTWEIAQGVQSTPENSLQYANDNALMLAKSLRGTLLALFYSSTFLSALTSAGLVLLGIQLKSEKN